jgi:putative MATE family efflux protein
MSRAFGKYLTVGSIPRTLLHFAIPVFLGNILSSGYSIVNAVWVGHLLGGRAVAAVGLTFPVILLMVAVCSGLTVASSVLVGQHFGARQERQIQEVVDVSWSIAAVLCLAVTAAGELGAPRLLALLGTPPEVLAPATSYLRLVLASFGLMYASFLIMSTLRAVGNTKVPLLFVVLGTALNAILDPLLISGAGPFPKLGLDGAAVASLVSGAVATLAGFAYLKLRYGHSPLVPRRLAFPRTLVGKLARIGLPSFVQQSLLSFAVAFMTALVNRHGATATAAFGIAGRIDTLVAVPAMAVMVAVSSVTAQNLGAGKPERVKQVFRWGLLVNTPAILAVTVVCCLAPAAVMRLFVREPEIVRLGAEYLRIVGVGYLFLIPPYVSNGVIVGSGKTAVTMLLSFVSLCVVRVPLAIWLSRTPLGLTGVWIATASSFSVNAVLGYLYYRSGRWQRPLGTGPRSAAPPDAPRAGEIDQAAA